MLEMVKLGLNTQNRDYLRFDPSVSQSQDMRGAWEHAVRENQFTVMHGTRNVLYMR